MKLTIGAAPDSRGIWFPSDPRQTPWQLFLDEIKEAGYDHTELGRYGCLPSDVASLRGELAKRGLKVTGSFVLGDLADPGRRRCSTRPSRNLSRFFSTPASTRIVAAIPSPL